VHAVGSHHNAALDEPNGIKKFDYYTDIDITQRVREVYSPSEKGIQSRKEHEGRSTKPVSSLWFT